MHYAHAFVAPKHARRRTPVASGSASTETRRFYSYEFSEDGRLIEPTVYELDDEAVHLAQVVNGKSGVWTDPTHLKINETETLALKGMGVERKSEAEMTFAGVESPAVSNNKQIDLRNSLERLARLSRCREARGIDVS
jgi:hypothetical protein